MSTISASRELLVEFDSAASRLVCNKHTSNIKSADIIKLGLCARKELSSFGYVLTGGVFNADTDHLWMLAAGSEIELNYKPGQTSIECDKVFQICKDLLRSIQDMAVPKNESFTVKEAPWCPGQMTVFANRDLKRSELIGNYEGYYVASNEPSNERYNATVGGTRGEITCDPCLGYESPLLEWTNSVTHRINEPPMGQRTNCMWRVRRGESPQILAAQDILSGEEVFIFYGNGHAPLRDYPIESGLAWQETTDSFDSDRDDWHKPQVYFRLS